MPGESAILRGRRAGLFREFFTPRFLSAYFLRARHKFSIDQQMLFIAAAEVQLYSLW